MAYSFRYHAYLEIIAAAKFDADSLYAAGDRTCMWCQHANVTVAVAGSSRTTSFYRTRAGRGPSVVRYLGSLQLRSWQRDLRGPLLCRCSVLRS